MLSFVQRIIFDFVAEIMLNKSGLLKDDIFFYNPQSWHGREFSCEISLQLLLADYSKAYGFQLPMSNQADKDMLEKQKYFDFWLVAQNKTQIGCHQLLLKGKT